MTPDVSAAPSAAPVESNVVVTAADQAVATNDYSAFKEAKRAERTGKPLDPTPAADSSPAETPAADSSSADPVKRSDKRATENRLPVLASENAKLKARIAELEAAHQAQPPKQDVATDSSPATAKPTAPTYPDHLQSFDAYLAKTPEGDYETYLESRADVRSEWRQATREAETRERAAASEHVKRVQERDTKFRERMDAATKTDPQFFETLSEDVKRLKPFDAIRDANGRWTEQPSGRHAIATEILDSEHSAQLMRHFTDHPEELSRIAALHPTALLKEMTKLELSFGGTGKPAAAATPPKLVTDQPDPPTQLGRRPAEPEDPTDAAVKSGDFAAFKAEAQRKRAAQHGVATR